MPQHDPNDPSATGRPPFGGDAESIDDEDFWERARRTKKEDKKASKRIGRKATSSRKRKTPPRSGGQVSFGLPPTGGAKGGTDYPVSPRVARARRQLQGLPPDPEPEVPPPGRGGFRDRLTGRQQPVGPPPIPDPPRQPIPMPPPTAPMRPVRPAAHAAPPSPPSPPSRPAPGPPTAPTPQVPPPTGPGTPPLMSPLLANSRLAGRRAQRSGLTGQTPAVPDPAGPPRSPGPSTPGGPLGSPGAPAPREPDRTPRRPPLLTGRTGHTGRTSGEIPTLPPSSSTRARSRLTGAGRGSGAAGTPGGAADLRTPGGAGPGGQLGGPPPTLPQRPAPRRSLGVPPSSRSSDPDLLASPPRGTSATGPLPSSRRRTGVAPPVSPPAGTPAWDPASTASTAPPTGTPGLGRTGRTGRTGGRAGAGAAGLADAAGAGAAGRRPGAGDPGATGKMPRTSYPASGRTPTGPGGDGGPMLNATQQAPVTGARRRGPATGSTPLVGPNTGGSLGPISAELPVVEPGPVAGVEPSPWEPPPVPRVGATRPTEPRIGPLSGEVPALDERFDEIPPRGTPRGLRPVRGPQPVTTQIDLDTGLDRGFERGFDGLPVSPSGPPGPSGPDRGPRSPAGAVGSGPGTMTRRPSYDDGGFDDHDDAYDDDRLDDHDDDFDGSERQGCGRLAVPLVVAAVVLCIVLVATAVWARRQINPGGAPGPAVSVEIESGQSTSDIGKALEEADVITSASVWTWYVRFRGGGDVQAGTYELHENMSMGDVLDALTSGPQPAEARPVTVAEGLSVRQLVSKLTSGNGAVQGFTAEGMQAAIDDPAMRSEIVPADAATIEGTLFPETYNISEDATEAELVQKMVDQFDAVTTELNLVGGAESLGYSPYEVLIVASLVEEEAKFPEERAQVARVIYNRLGRQQALQIDATSCYEKGETPCRLTQADLDSDSPYNTRRQEGLPPTPISSPGQASIQAALHPAEGDFIYYVRKDAEGHHLFTASDEEFQQAKQVCIEQGWGCG